MPNDLKRADRGYRVGVLFFLALPLLFVLHTGCQSLNPLPGLGVGDATPEEVRIRKLMKWHSARVAVYRDFRTVFTARAVYLSDEIQRLAADWEIKSTLMNPEERKAFEERFFKGDSQFIKILVGFYTPEEELNDLNEDNSTWIPYLKNSDGTVRRASCLSVSEENARIYMRFLKWDLSWSKLYLLCFPSSPELSTDEEGRISVVISGPQGSGEIRLQVTPPDDQT